MAFDTSKLTKLAALQSLATKTKSQLDALNTKVADLVAEGGEPNVIETIKINGTAQSITDKTVDIAVPTKVSELTNDSNFQTSAEVATTVSGEIAKIVADAPEDFDTLKELADWLSGHETDAAAMNSTIKSNTDAITALQNLIGSIPEGASSTTVIAYIQEAISAIDLSDYAKTSEVSVAINTALASYVTLQALTTKLENYYTSTQVDELLDDHLTEDDVATDSEVEEMLTAVFGE